MQEIEYMMYDRALFTESKGEAKANRKAQTEQLKLRVTDRERHVFIDHPGGIHAPKPARAKMAGALREGRIVLCRSLIHLITSESDFETIRELFRAKGAKCEFLDAHSQDMWDKDKSYFVVRAMFRKAQTDAATAAPQIKPGSGRKPGFADQEKAEKAYSLVRQFRSTLTIETLANKSEMSKQGLYNIVRRVAAMYKDERDPFTNRPLTDFLDKKTIETYRNLNSK